MAMKASYFVGKGSFEVRQAPELHPGAGEVVVRNKFCGVCGTDVHIFHGEPGSADVNPPVVLGHEYSGEIVEVGEGVTDLQVGDHVTVDPNIYCGKCEHCRNGKKQLCESMEAIGVTRDGGFAEYSRIPASQAFKLDPAVPYEAAAMAEPLACCLHGIDLAGIKPGQKVCVIGGGAIGLIMVQRPSSPGHPLWCSASPTSCAARWAWGWERTPPSTPPPQMPRAPTRPPWGTGPTWSSSAWATTPR